MVHLTNDGSNKAKVSLVDVWAGVSAFSEGFHDQSHVIVEEFSWIENALPAVLVLQAVYEATQYCLGFYDNSWLTWKFTYDLIVTVGPRCCPFSVSGKRLRHNDPRASQVMSTAMLAIYLCALVLIVENVVNLRDEDHIHHLVSDVDGYLLDNGMVAMADWRLLDSDYGGSSGREREYS